MSFMRKVWKWSGIFAGVLLALSVVYVIYVFIAYDRLPDKMTLQVAESGENSDFKNSDKFSGKKSYSIMTYNIGFGAYQPDYSFFMEEFLGKRRGEREGCSLWCRRVCPQFGP